MKNFFSSPAIITFIALVALSSLSLGQTPNPETLTNPITSHRVTIMGGSPKKFFAWIELLNGQTPSGYIYFDDTPTNADQDHIGGSPGSWYVVMHQPASAFEPIRQVLHNEGPLQIRFHGGGTAPPTAFLESARQLVPPLANNLRAMPARAAALADAITDVSAPVQLEFTTSDTARVAFTSRGSSSSTSLPVVVLAGGPGFDGRALEPVARIVGQTHRTIVPDHRGTGRSREGNVLSLDTINLKRAVADVDELRQHLGFEKWIVLGHSWGGQLALAYAAEHPDRVGGMILIGSAGPDLSYGEVFVTNLNGRLAPDELAVKLLWKQRLKDPNYPDPVEADFQVFKASWPGYLHDRSSLPAMASYFQKVFSFPDVRGLMSESSYDVKGRLTAIQTSVPVSIVVGASDPMDRSIAEQITKEIPHSKIEMMPECGHYPWVEKPQAFEDLLTKLLSAK